MIHFIFLEFLKMSPVIRKTFVPSSADICIQAATFYSMPVVFTTQAQVCLVNTYIHIGIYIWGDPQRISIYGEEVNRHTFMSLNWPEAGTHTKDE